MKKVYLFILLGFIPIGITAMECEIFSSRRNPDKQLLWAMHFGRTQEAASAIECGANVNSWIGILPDEFIRHSNLSGLQCGGHATPLIHAVVRGQWEIATKLLEKGAQVNGVCCDKDRRSALFFAPDEDICKGLLNYGADPFLQDCSGKIPGDCFSDSASCACILDYMIQRDPVATRAIYEQRAEDISIPWRRLVLNQSVWMGFYAASKFLLEFEAYPELVIDKYSLCLSPHDNIRNFMLGLIAVRNQSKVTLLLCLKHHPNRCMQELYRRKIISPYLERTYVPIKNIVAKICANRMRGPNPDNMVAVYEYYLRESREKFMQEEQLAAEGKQRSIELFLAQEQEALFAQVGQQFDSSPVILAVVQKDARSNKCCVMQ